MVGFVFFLVFFFFFFKQKTAYEILRSDCQTCALPIFYPAEVEKILLNHPKIAQVAIIGVNDDKWGEVGMAFVIPEEAGQVVTIEEIHEFLKTRIAKYKHPARVQMMTELPL